MKNKGQTNPEPDVLPGRKAFLSAITFSDPPKLAPPALAPPLPKLGPPEQAKLNWEANHADEVGIYTNVMALQAAVANASNAFASRLARCRPSDNGTSALSHFLWRLDLEQFDKETGLSYKQLAMCTVLLEIARSSPEFKIAQAEYSPYIIAAKKYRDDEDAKFNKKLRAERKLRDARRQAKETALAKAESDPAVVEAKKEVELISSEAGCL
jgi:hypothetical protein